MTKVIKKTIVTILLLCMVCMLACFVACGKNTPDDPSNENRQEQQANGENGQNDQNQTFPDSDNVPDIILSADGKSVIGLKNHNLTNLVISPSYNGVTVTSIGDSAFENCDSLISVTIPDTVIIIGTNAFRDCSSLMNVYYTGTIDQWVQIDFCSLSSNYQYVNPLNYAENFYINDVLVTEAKITTATKINAYAFYGYDSLTSVTIGNSVTSIGSGAFYGCYKLVEVINKSNQHNGYLESYALNVKTDGTSDIINKDGYLFYTYDSVNYLLGYVGNETSLTLPENYNGQNYEIYKYAFRGCSSLTSITIPDNVISIGEEAFNGCGSLVSITIGNSVTSIGDYAFHKCSSLTSVTIGKGVTSIGGYYNSNYKIYINQAFKYCYKLVEVINRSNLTITKGSEENGGVGYYALNVKTEGESEIVNKNDYLFYTSNGVNYLFGYVGSKTSLTLPDSYNGQNYKIQNYAFRDCRSLTSVNIPNSVTSIGEFAFYNCRSLTSIEIPDSVTDIGSYAFYKCSSLMSVTMGENVASIGSTTFEDCYRLVEVINKSSLDITKGSRIGYCALNVKNSGESEIVNKDGFLFYTYNNENYLFGYVGNETKLTLPQGFNGKNYVIGEKAFYECKSLTGITIPNGVTSIEESAFEYCSLLTNVTIGENVKKIGERAFNSCDSLTSVIIPDSVTSIGEWAFSCHSLMSVSIGENVASIGNDAFRNCYKLAEVINKSNLTITKGSGGNGYIGYYALKIKKSGESEIVNKNGYYFYTYGVENYLLGYICNTTELTLPDNYNGQNYSIYNSAFKGFSLLSNVTIPNSVTSIGDNAFYNCESLASVTIGNSVTSIGDSAFSFCLSIEKINYNGDINDWVQIEGLSNLMRHGKSKNLYLNGKLLTEANITTATKINGSAFEGCDSLTNVTIENSVTSIGKYAFMNCDSLTNVTFENSNGWYVNTDSTATSGTNLTLTDAAQNATYLTSTYEYYYWKRK